MKLYHYATWSGEKIERERIIKPARRYAEFTNRTLLTEWPELTFLTQSPEWEPSIQSLSRESYWEKCGSHPETNAALGIPCWKFEVNPNNLVLGEVKDFHGDRKWWIMLEDAMTMGSDPTQWKVAVQDCYVINAWKWEDDEWRIVKTG